MKIIWIEKKEETYNYYITKAKFKTWWGKTIIKTCITEKGMSWTNFYDSGMSIPVNLWEPFRVFLESKKDYFEVP